MPGHTASMDPGPPVLRKFGCVMAALIAGLFGLLLPWIWGFSIPAWPWMLAALFGVAGLVRPTSLRLVYRGWMGIAEPLGRFNSRLLLVLVFYVIVLPIGLVMRLGGKDPMRRRYDAAAASYRLPSKRAPRNSLEKPY